MSTERLISDVRTLYKERDLYITAMEQSEATDAISVITGLIEECARK